MKKPYAILSITLILGLCVIVAFLSFRINALVSSQFNEQNIYKESLLVDIKELKSENQQLKLKNDELNQNNDIEKENLQNKMTALESENEHLKSSLEQLNKTAPEDNEFMEPYYKLLLEKLEINNDPENLMYYPRQEYDGNYKVDSTLFSFEYVKSYLDSFRKLTDTVCNTLSDEQQLSIGNLSWDVQTLGIHNHTNSVLVGIRELNFIVKKLNFELAIKKFQLKEITLEELDKKTDEYKKARDEFIEYAKGVSFAD